MSRLPGAAMKAARISRPTAVRMGMFCRLGLVELRRPVAVPTWLKVVWMRPSASASCGQRVEVGALELLQLAMLETHAAISWCSASSSRTSCAVETTLPLPYFMGLGRSILLKRTSPSCLGRVDVEAVAGRRVDFSARSSMVTARREDMLAERSGSMRTPVCSMRRRTGTRGGRGRCRRR
jgi:2-methylaconitate cis-trans-isomerase PrpF